MNEILMKLLGEDYLSAIVTGIIAAGLLGIATNIISKLAPKIKEYVKKAFDFTIYRMLRVAVIEQARLVALGDQVRIVAYFTKQKAMLNFYLFLCLLICMITMLQIQAGIEMTLFWISTKAFVFFLAMSLALKKLGLIIASSSVSVPESKKQTIVLDASDSKELDGILEEFDSLQSDSNSVFHKSLVEDYIEKSTRVALNLSEGCLFKIVDLIEPLDWATLSVANRKAIGRAFRRVVDEDHSSNIEVYSNKGMTTYIKR